MRTLIATWVIVFVAFVGTPAFAHTSGVSFLSLRGVDTGTVEAQFDFDVRDLNELVALDRNSDGELTWGEIESRAASIREAVADRTRLRAMSDCVAVESGPISLAEHGDGPFVRVHYLFRCDGAATTLSLDHRGWFEFDPGHRGLLEFTSSDGKTTQLLLSKSSPTWQITASQARRVRRFFAEGAHHLVTGYDHLAFLGVLLLALLRRPERHSSAAPLPAVLKRAVVIITAFTLAHSATLFLAATGFLLLPSKPVEVVIAASVALSAVLNLWRGAGGHGAKLAFCFGLIHGLGFAGALAEMAGDGIDLLSLAAFNIGIELAQIMVAAVAVPLLWVLFRNARNEKYGLPVASLSVAALAFFWVVSRLSS